VIHGLLLQRKEGRSQAVETYVRVTTAWPVSFCAFECFQIMLD